jgi:uncharacterized membrane protein SpoIIM required for sporulation
MRLSKFIEEHQATWSKLEHLLEEISDKRPTKAQIDQFGKIYRSVASHLAFAQTYFPSHDVTDYLSQLTIRSHNLIYGKAQKSYWKQVKHFFIESFPLFVWQRFSFFLLAMGLFTAGGLLAFLLTYMDQSYASYFLPPEFTAVDPAKIEENQWNPVTTSSEIMVNNIQVSFLALALGALFGIGTIWILFSNGLLIGALSAIFHKAGYGYEFWAFILPHGVIELTAIFIAGAAGLSLAYHFFVPGEQTRIHSVIREGRISIQLMLGVVLMLVIAGLVEGFITPSALSYEAKYALSVLHLILCVAYLAYPVWKHKKSKQQTTS